MEHSLEFPSSPRPTESSPCNRIGSLRSEILAGRDLGLLSEKPPVSSLCAVLLLNATFFPHIFAALPSFVGANRPMCRYWLPREITESHQEPSRALARGPCVCRTYFHNLWEQTKSSKPPLGIAKKHRGRRGWGWNFFPLMRDFFPLTNTLHYIFWQGEDPGQRVHPVMPKFPILGRLRRWIIRQACG